MTLDFNETSVEASNIGVGERFTAPVRVHYQWLSRKICVRVLLGQAARNSDVYHDRWQDAEL